MIPLRILLGFQTTRSASALPRSAVWRTIIRYKALSRLQRVETSAQPVANSSSPAWISQWAFTSKFPRAITIVFRGCVVELTKMMDLMDGRASYMLIIRLQAWLYQVCTSSFSTDRVAHTKWNSFLSRFRLENQAFSFLFFYFYYLSEEQEIWQNLGATVLDHSYIQLIIN